MSRLQQAIAEATTHVTRTLPVVAEASPQRLLDLIFTTRQHIAQLLVAVRQSADHITDISLSYSCLATLEQDLLLVLLDRFFAQPLAMNAAASLQHEQSVIACLLFERVWHDGEFQEERRHGGEMITATRAAIWRAWLESDVLSFSVLRAAYVARHAGVTFLRPQPLTTAPDQIAEFIVMLCTLPVWPARS